MQQIQQINQNNIVQCFIHIHDPNSTPIIRKKADNFLMNSQKQLIPLIKVLLQIFQNDNNTYNIQIRLQALLYLNNTIKRNWNKKQFKTDSNLAQIKKQVSALLINYLQHKQNIFRHNLFDIIKFIVKSDYPHSFHQFSTYSLILLSTIKINDQNVNYFKELRDIFIQLAERKGFANAKNYQQGPLKLLNALRPISQSMRQQLCKNQNVSNQVAKLSKYCDQMTLCLIRIAPFSYLDDNNFMTIMKQIITKLQNLLSVHATQSNKNKALLQKDIKSIVYQLGCVQEANPCIIAEIMSDYISTLFYIISKPQIFIKPACLKYGLLTTRKLIKQFTYYSQESIFIKSSSSSHSKSNNYLQLKSLTHKIYVEFLTEDNVKRIINFLITSVMNVKGKQDQGLVVGFDGNQQSITDYQKSTEKDLSVHICSTLLAESLIQRFTQQMLQILYLLLKSCIQSKWTNIDTQTQINFLSILSILPKTCKRNQLNYLLQYPIIDVLQFTHNSLSLGIKQKFPILVNGWLDIFTNQQIGQLVQVLLNYIQQGQKNNKIQILLYSCYSLNKIITLKTTSVNNGHILNKIFPVAIKIFEQTQSPQVLWPLINLITTLITKCQFESNIIISSIQSKSLNSLIQNQSQMLVEALCQMFKSFLCIIPRNQPAVAVFKLVYHFLNIHLAKIHALYHQKCVTLWYYSIREFSTVNQCNQLYYQLFDNYFNKCLFTIKPIFIYILQQYMLLGLIEQKLDTFIQKIIQFYRQGQYIQSAQKYTNINISHQNQNSMQQGIKLKIAALSFQITLITKYNLQKVNSQQMLYIVMKDFCCISDQSLLHNNIKVISHTLQNSLLSIINRYIMINPDYFFNFLKSKMDITPPSFFLYYFKNMLYITSRTALRINALALASLLTQVQNLFKPYDIGQVLPCIINMLKIMIPQLQQHIKYLSGVQGIKMGKIQNTPTFRFSQSILSQRKQQIRKQGSYQQIDLKQYFLKQFQQVIQNLSININVIIQLLNQNQDQQNWSSRLITICQ